MWKLKLSMALKPAVVATINPVAKIQDLTTLAAEKLGLVCPNSEIILQGGYPLKVLDNPSIQIDSVLHNNDRVVVSVTGKCKGNSKNETVTAGAKRSSKDSSDDEVEVVEAPSKRPRPAISETKTNNDIGDMKIRHIKKELQSYGVATEHMLEKSEMIQALVNARAKQKLSADMMPPDSSSSSPIKLFQTALDRGNRQNPLVKEHCWSLRQMLGLENSSANGQIDWIVVSNFMVDFEHLLETLPELYSIPTSVVFYQEGYNQEAMANWKRMNSNVEFVVLNPQAEPEEAANPLKYKFRFGCHHTKMFLLGRSDGTIRVIVHTANLLPGDLAVKAQGAFVQDFPLKSTTGSSESSQFEDDIVDYMTTYGYTKSKPWGPTGRAPTTLLDLLKRYDFSGAKGVLIASTPGYYNMGAAVAKNRGYLKLTKAIRENCPRKTAHATPVVCQFSSLGALSVKWLKEFSSSVSAQQRECDQLEGSLLLVFPTPDEIRNSVEGYAGGGTVPSKLTNVSKPFLKPLWHKWTSGNNNSNPLYKPKNVPHIKTYFQTTSGDKHASRSSELQWFCVTSHNLSKAAWGEKRTNQRGQHLYIPSWELGVLVAPSLFGNDKKLMAVEPGKAACSSSISDNHVGIPIPYAAHPTRYSTKEEPFSWEAQYPTAPDRFGRISARG